ncbi:MAG: VirB3 family type IV secretion system protein [Candidatus Omnitrophica bacterium]|nr:VirB3 family type IV secretion system protein [Candidatus Omnitrophota bacterium]
MKKKIKIPIHKSLTQPVLIAGGERQLVMLISFTSLAIWVAGTNLLALTLALIVWFIGIAFARAIAKGDAHRTKIFIRHVKYHDYYPATEKINNKINEYKTFKV